LALISVPGREVADPRGTLPVREGCSGYPARPLEGIQMAVIHYSGVDADSSALQIARYQTGKAEGDPFPEIAYSFVVRRDGQIEQCHDLETRSWHAGGHNNDTGVGICLPGLDWPAEPQLASAAALVTALQRELGRGLRVVGHKELRATACPGPNWPIWKEHLLRLTAGETRRQAAASPSTIPVVLGFRRLYDRLGPELCGVPLAPEGYDGSGNSNQPFSRCEMRWDKGENRVWVNFKWIAEG